MAENVGSDESEFDSVTSSQKSFLKNCPFADPESPPTKSSRSGVEETDTGSYSTEILGNPISPPLIRTPVLSLSTPISLDSINDEDVFRTPPENASLSSAAESEHRVRVSEMKLKSPSSKTETTPVSASPSLPAENVRVLETNRTSDSEEPVTEVTPLSSPPSPVAGNVSITGKHSDSDSPSPIVIGRNRVLENQPITGSLTNTGVPKSLSPARVPGKHSGLGSPSPVAIERTMVLENQPVSDSVANTGVPKSPSPVSSSPSATEGIKVTETDSPCDDDDDEIDIPFKEVIEALLRNNGENLDERDEKVSYSDILKQFGLKFS